MNFILAIGIFAWIFVRGFQPIEIIKEFQPSSLLTEVVEDSRVFRMFEDFDSFRASDIYEKAEYITLYPWEELPAYEAGVRIGDKVTAINGESIVDATTIQEIVGANNQVVLSLLSNGEQKNITITPEEGKI